MTRHPTFGAVVAVAMATLVSSLAAGPTWGSAPDPDHLQHRLVTTFDATGSNGAFAESMTPDDRGNLVVSVTSFGDTGAMLNEGRVVRVMPNGTQHRVGPAIPLGPFAQLMGIDVDVDGRVFVAVLNFAETERQYAQSPPNGVYRVTSTGLQRIVTLPPGTFPNGLRVWRGKAYLTDSLTGAVWRGPTRRMTSPSTPWLQDHRLAPTSLLGANGITAHRGSLYVGSSDGGRVLRVPVRRNGTPGTPSVYVKDTALLHSDGIAFDRQGRLWVTVNPTVDWESWTQDGEGSLALVGHRGGVRFAATPVGSLDYPTQVVIMSGTAYVVNGSFVNGTPTIAAFTG